MKLSLIFPVYNEVKSIADVLERFSRYCQDHHLDHELIVVNDGSIDTTENVVKTFSLTHSTIRYIKHEKNLGYGAALRSGFRAATGEYIFFTDGDGQFRPDDMDQTISLLDPQTIVLGYREPRTEGTIRRLNAWWWGRLVGAKFGFHVRDLNCAWKAFPRSLLSNVKFISSGAFISAEIVHHARQKNLLFHEIPVHHYAREFGSPTGANPRVIWNAFQELARFLLRRPQ